MSTVHVPHINLINYVYFAVFGNLEFPAMPFILQKGNDNTFSQYLVMSWHGLVFVLFIAFGLFFLGGGGGGARIVQAFDSICLCWLSLLLVLSYLLFVIVVIVCLSSDQLFT